MILRTNSSPVDAFVAVELISAPDSRIRFADAVKVDDAAVAPSDSFCNPPFAVTLDATTTEADPV